MIIKQNNFLCIPAHARLTYDLSGNELLAYGLIHGFSQDGISWYDGGQQYIADWCGISRRRVRDVLDRLLSIGAIEKKDVIINNVTFCKYRAVLTEDETSYGDGTKRPNPVEETSHNNIGNTILNNINEDNSSSRINTSKNNISSIGEKKTKKEIDLSFVGIEYIGAMERWIAFHKEIGKPYTKTGVEGAYRRLLMLSNQDARVADQIVEQSIANGWQGLFELKQSKQSNYGNSSNETPSLAKQFAANLKATGSIFG